MKNNIILIGMPAVGKSTIGVVVAKRLGYEFLDTDLVIQKKEQRLLNEIIEQEGIEGFIKIENEVNKSIEVKNTVIAPGGSVVYCQEAMEHFAKIGTIVYLKVSFETINERIQNATSRGVVLKQGQTLADVYKERIPLFEKYADIEISEDNKNMEETIDKVMELLGNRSEKEKHFTNETYVL